MTFSHHDPTLQPIAGADRCGRWHGRCRPARCHWLAKDAIGADVVHGTPRGLPISDGEGILHDDREAPDAGRPGDPRQAVLVVHANKALRERLGGLLGKWWDVQIAADGRAALDAVAVRKPDLVLTDVMMAGLDGRRLVALLREDPQLIDMPIIILSARDDEEARIEGMSLGADDYLVKPVAPRELVARVRANLARARLRRNEGAAIARLYELGSRLTVQPDLPALLQEVLEATMELEGADFGRIQLYDEGSQSLRIVAHLGVGQDFLDYFARADANDTSACGLALRTGTRIIIPDVELEPDYRPHLAIAAATGYRAVVTTPLVDGGRPVGMLTTLFRQPHRPSARMLRLTDFYARQAAEAISARVARERQRQSEARLQSAVDLLELGLYAWNLETNALQWDATVKAMWGLPAESDVDYAQWDSAIHPDDRPRVEAAIRACSEPGGSGVYDAEYRVTGLNDGVERWVATRGLMHFDKGRPASLNGVALDVTRRKRLESALDRQVKERTRELEETNRELRAQIEQRQMAEAVAQQLQRIEAIGHITSGVAHDFNNLLTVILTNARLLVGSVRDPDDQEGLDLIRTAAERGAKLTAQLLVFAREQRLEPQVIDLNRKIARMGELLQATLGGAVHLETRLARDLWSLSADPTQLELVILNLAINARDAMQARGTLVLETFNTTIERKPSRPEDPNPGPYIGLAVIDSGCGIPQDVLARVFEPFFTTKEPGRGSGLGLAQVFGFVKQSGGGVRIDTRVGEGTSVTVFLPRAKDAGSDERDDAAPRAAPAHPGRATILVVDDDEGVLRSTVRTLVAMGHDAVPAANGREALRLLAGPRPIDLVLADIGMPEISGPELAGSIRETLPGLPVILITGHGEQEVKLPSRHWPVLRKPFDQWRLAEEIAAALDRARARGHSA